MHGGHRQRRPGSPTPAPQTWRIPRQTLDETSHTASLFWPRAEATQLHPRKTMLRDTNFYVSLGFYSGPL